MFDQVGSVIKRFVTDYNAPEAATNTAVAKALVRYCELLAAPKHCDGPRISFYICRKIIKYIK